MTAPVQHPMYIDGQFVSGRGDGWIDVLNPATEALLSRIPDGTAEEARLAIDAAERAQPGWEALPAIERAGWLRKIAAGIRQRADEIAGLIVAEGGKIQQLAGWRLRSPRTISTIWQNGRAVTKVRSCRAIARGRISLSLNARWG
ncbi:NAD-linked aldehyde dehydrogenase A [Klebsiella pneumoniae]|uniref:NAD-linked aldehyde dehydrogenase A n=1 Tax=Klebsiella pneumoniae TaxID=573 RepID=A0A2X3I6J9_KLEPN|nr:NAD-linked aldehyde dehydrogenase A [Klebsiella pneumoniae]